MRVSSRSDIREILPLVRTPTLVLHRTGDQIEPIEGGRYVASKMPNARLVELPGEDGIPWLGDTASVFAEIEDFVGRAPEQREVASRRLGTILFTDIVGSTQHLASLGDAAWRRALSNHDDIAKREIARAGGTYVTSTGDGLLATFEGPAAAVRCAEEIGHAVRALDIEIRAGVHTGELESVGEDVRGIAVHIAARIMSLAGPSEVLVSSVVRDLTAGSGLIFEEAGAHGLKGVPDTWHLFRVVSQ